MKKQHDVVQVIYDQLLTGQDTGVGIVIRGNSDPVDEKRWVVIDMHELSHDEVFGDQEYTVPARLLHTLEKAILSGSRLIPDDMR